VAKEGDTLRCMSYLVLARKYRPQDFATVTGQVQVTRTLANAIKRNRVAHAHLFCGPRGVGKTSIARIFAKALNCEGGPKTNPCMKCANCLEITAGSSLAVREIDGASHNSVDNVRDLIDSFRSMPPPGSPYKVYIIDEVHMLSIAAFNALLKSLEEPPPNTVFILATTEVHKIPDTVLSRCVRHEFRALPLLAVQERLTEIALVEKLDVEPAVLTMIARLSEGSMRDAQTLLERVQSFCEDKITALEASLVLGSVDRITLLKLVDSILERAPKLALEIVQDIFSRGLDPTVLLREFVSIWRELLLVSAGVDIPLCLDKEELRGLAKKSSSTDLQDLVTLARQGCDTALRSSYVRIAFEALVARLATREPVASVGELLALVRSGGVGSAGSAGSAGGSGNKTSITNTGSSNNGFPNTGPANTGPANTGPANAGNPKEPSAALEAGSRLPNIIRQNAATAQVLNSDTAALFSWENFVIHLATASDLAAMTRQSLKMCSAKVTAKTVIISAQKFIIAGLSDMVPKLEELLGAYDPKLKGLRIEFSAITSASNSDKVEENQVTQNRVREVTEDKIANHPALKSIQALFPGSSIESIRDKIEKI